MLWISNGLMMLLYVFTGRMRPINGMSMTPEVFVVLDGVVEMHIRRDGVEEVLRLRAGDIFHAEDGDEHFASPDGPARILVIEKAGSI